MSAKTVHTRAVSEFISNTEFKDLPSNVVNHLKACILDGLGCGLFGSRNVPWALTAADYVKEIGGREEATLWGQNFKGPAIVTEYSATTFVPPGVRFRQDFAGNLVIDLR